MSEERAVSIDIVLKKLSTRENIDKLTPEEKQHASQLHKIQIAVTKARVRDARNLRKRLKLIQKRIKVLRSGATDEDPPKALKSYTSISSLEELHQKLESNLKMYDSVKLETVAAEVWIESVKGEKLPKDKERSVDLGAAIGRWKHSNFVTDQLKQIKDGPQKQTKESNQKRKNHPTESSDLPPKRRKVTTAQQSSDGSVSDDLAEFTVKKSDGVLISDGHESSGESDSSEEFEQNSATSKSSKRKRTNKQTMTSHRHMKDSIFVESLSGKVDGVKIRKNRMGQRARRLLQLKTYGNKAKAASKPERVWTKRKTTKSFSHGAPFTGGRKPKRPKTEQTKKTEGTTSYSGSHPSGLNRKQRRALEHGSHEDPKPEQKKKKEIPPTDFNKQKKKKDIPPTDFNKQKKRKDIPPRDTFNKRPVVSSRPGRARTSDSSNQHPSWIAKQKQKVKMNATFSGKKTVF
eukprot:385233_1